MDGLKKMDNLKKMVVREMMRTKNFTEAWVSHIPDDPAEHGVEELSEENLRRLIEEDDATYIEPGDSASQVGSLARQVSLLLKAVRQDGSSNGGVNNGSDKPLPRRLRAVLEQLAGNNNNDDRLKDKPPKIPRKKNDAESKIDSNDAAAAKKESSHHFAVPALPSLTTTVSRKKRSFKQTKSSTSATAPAAVAAAIPLLPVPTPELPDIDGGGPEAEPKRSAPAPSVSSQVDKSSSNSRKSSKIRKPKQIFMPVSNVAKMIERYSARSGNNGDRGKNYDEHFVNAVAAAGIVYTRKVIKRAEQTARKNGHDFVHTSDMMEIFRMEHGKTLTESHLKRLEELMPNL